MNFQTAPSRGTRANHSRTNAMPRKRCSIETLARLQHASNVGNMPLGTTGRPSELINVRLEDLAELLECYFDAEEAWLHAQVNATVDSIRRASL